MRSPPALEEQHALFDFVAPHAGHVTAKGGASVKINKAAPNAPSVLYDAAIVPGGTRSESLVGSKLAHQFLGEDVLAWQTARLFRRRRKPAGRGPSSFQARTAILKEGEVDMTAFIEIDEAAPFSSSLEREPQLRP